MELKVIASLIILVVTNIIIFCRANDYIGYSSVGYYKPSPNKLNAETLPKDGWLTLKENPYIDIRHDEKIISRVTKQKRRTIEKYDPINKTGDFIYFVFSYIGCKLQITDAENSNNFITPTFYTTDISFSSEDNSLWLLTSSPRIINFMSKIKSAVNVKLEIRHGKDTIILYMNEIPFDGRDIMRKDFLHILTSAAKTEYEVV